MTCEFFVCILVTVSFGCAKIAAGGFSSHRRLLKSMEKTLPVEIAAPDLRESGFPEKK